MKFLKRERYPPKYGLDSACSAREQITAFGLYCSLSGQAIAESSFTPSPKGSAPKTPMKFRNSKRAMPAGFSYQAQVPRRLRDL